MGEVIDITSILNDKRIDEINDNYLMCLEFIGINRLDDRVINNIEDIEYIKEFSNEIKTTFIKLFNRIDNNDDLNILKKVDLISNLVELFLNLKEEVNKYSEEKLINAVAYKTINETSLEESLKFLQESIKRRKQ